MTILLYCKVVETAFKENTHLDCHSCGEKAVVPNAPEKKAKADAIRADFWTRHKVER